MRLARKLVAVLAVLSCFVWTNGCTHSSPTDVRGTTSTTSVTAPTGYLTGQVGTPMLVVMGKLYVRDYSLPLIDDVKIFMSVKDFDFAALGTVVTRDDEEVPKEELAAVHINVGATVYIEGMGGRIYVLDNGVLIPMHLRTEE